MIKVHDGILGGDSAPKLPESIVLRGVTCTVNWKGVGGKEKAAASPNSQASDPKEPWEDPVWGPRAVKKRLEAWEDYKTQRMNDASREEDVESQRLLRRPRGQQIQQALDNGRREEEERKQDRI